MTDGFMDLKHVFPIQDDVSSNDELNVFIGTPAYNSMIHTDYLHSIIDFHKNNFPITVMTIGNESLIPRGRNTIISYFHSIDPLVSYFLA